MTDGLTPMGEKSVGTVGGTAQFAVGGGAVLLVCRVRIRSTQAGPRFRVGPFGAVPFPVSGRCVDFPSSGFIEKG